MNFFGEAIFGYNIGVVSGLTRPLIECTLFDESQHVPVSLYQVGELFGLYCLGIVYLHYSRLCYDWITHRCLDFQELGNENGCSFFSTFNF